MQRDSQFKSLSEGRFDLLIIGGGATGAGIALDAASRGLRVALVERDDFASGTSSRSTKLIHGGVRYLEQAVKKFDRGQLNLVREALRERATILRLAPHLSHPLPLVTPLYHCFQIPYYRIGLKIYDWLAGKQNLNPSRYLSAKAALKNFPMLKAKGLKGGILYYDGQFDDARLNVTLAVTAAEHGALVMNHVEVSALQKEGGKITGAEVKDLLSGQVSRISARVVINATGPFADNIRRLEDPNVPPLLRASSGIHIVLDKRFSPPATGLLIPKTEDGRVLFLLPWLGHTLVGTTDNPAAIEPNPKPSEEDIQYILRHLEKYFDIPVTRDDVLSAWSGLRPLVSNPKANNTAGLSRDHVILVSPAGLVTVTGGKWTTYRKMAEDAVDEALHSAKLSSSQPSQTKQILLAGAEGFSGNLAQQLENKYSLPLDIAIHLAHSYGSRATQVAQRMREGYSKRLSPRHPYVEAEVVYAVEHEMACSVVDILARRTRLAFLDIQAARQAFPAVLGLMASLLGWSAEKCGQEEEKFHLYLDLGESTPKYRKPLRRAASASPRDSV